ncbi:aconitate hydratase [Phlyctochytrium planicorne]|nr:aconitate hydratase [Phlyctochytrium planicorne]
MGRGLGTIANSTKNFVGPKYGALQKRLEELKRRQIVKGPLTLAEKILYSHVASAEEKIERGQTYLKLNPAYGGADGDLSNSLEANREIFDFLESAASKYGISFWRPGSGIIHQIVLENYAAPGLMMLGTDSHTPNAGGLGAIAIGVGGADAVDGMAGIPWELKAPKIIGVNLTGSLSGWASPKDVILSLAGKLTVQGGTNHIIEYFGPGAKTLSCTGMATICNMGAEMGRYLQATNRGDVAEAAKISAASGFLQADPGVTYDKVIEIDLSSIEPHINGPFTPDAATPISKFKDVVKKMGWKDEISASLIGSCTNSSYEDMTRAASVVRAAKSNQLKVKTKKFLVTPGSEQIRATLERDNLTGEFESVGATVLANACGPCIGQWKRDKDELKTENAILTSFNRNFKARNDGNAKTMNFLASPEIVTAMAFSGKLSFDPTRDTLFTPTGDSFKFPVPIGDSLPNQGFLEGDKNMRPPSVSEPNPGINVVVDPKSQRLQSLTPFSPWDGKDLKGLKVLVKASGKCTTDHISAAGSWLKYKGHLDNISNNTLIGAVNAFNGKTNSVLNELTGKEDTIPNVGRHYKANNIDWVVIGDYNYGEGSAREHAALQPRYLGCRAVIVKSFARIHETNLKKQGVFPLVFKNPEDYDLIPESATVETSGLDKLEPGSIVKLVVSTPQNGKSFEIDLVHTLSLDQIAWIRAGIGRALCMGESELSLLRQAESFGYSPMSSTGADGIIATAYQNRDVYIEKEKDESPNDRNDRGLVCYICARILIKESAIRVACLWYKRHLANSSKSGVIMLSDDEANRKYAKQEDLLTASVKEYVESISAFPELADMVVLPEDDGADNMKSFEYPEHLTLSQILAGIKSGAFLQGTLSISIHNIFEGSVHAKFGETEKHIKISGREYLNRATHGDRVAVELFPMEMWKRLNEPPDIVEDDDGEEVDKKEDHMDVDGPLENNDEISPCGRIVGIIKRNWRNVCGTLEGKKDSAAQARTQTQSIYFWPMDKRIPKIRIRTRQLGNLLGKRIMVAIDAWPKTSRYPQGHFVRSLGEVGDKETETDVVLLEHDVPFTPFTKQVLNCLPPEGEAWIVRPEYLHGREDFRHLNVCSIDPPGCTDIDDTLHATELPNGNFEVGVHIADVSHFVQPGNAMDLEASRRGTTVYLVDRRIDMLPGLLGTNLCSLRSNVDRLAFSCVWEMTKEAEVISCRYTKSIIRSRASLTYDEAQARLDDAKLNDDISKSVKTLNRLAKKLRAKRLVHGALVLASPEVRFNLDNDAQDPVDLELKELKEANALVEEFMLLANIYVARKIQSIFPDSSMLRRHPKPPRTNFETLIKSTEKRGIEIDPSSNKSLSDSLDRAILKDDPYFNKLLRILTTRCMMQAVYFCSGTLPYEEFWHYGLATDIYTHFTSPIRRYADLIVHRLLAACIGYDKTYSSTLTDKISMSELCENLNYRNRMAQQAARSSVEIYTNLFFKGKTLDEEAYIVRVFRNGFAVLIPRYGVEGFVRVDQNAFHFDPVAMTLSNNGTAKVFELFGKVRVGIEVQEAGNSNAQSANKTVYVALSAARAAAPVKGKAAGKLRVPSSTVGSLSSIGQTTVKTFFVSSFSPLQTRSYASKAPVTTLGQGADITSPPDQSNYLKNLSNYDDQASRNLSYLLIGTYGFVQASAAKNIVTDLLVSLAPSADVLALAKVEVDKAAIPEGKNVVIKWRGKPVFIRHRTAEEISEAQQVNLSELRHQESDADRVKDPEWLVMLGVCTHLGCVPMGEAGEYNGWFCPCHGSHYDISGRIRKGPAPLNMEIPPYEFADDKIVIG